MHVSGYVDATVNVSVGVFDGALPHPAPILLLDLGEQACFQVIICKQVRRINARPAIAFVQNPVSFRDWSDPDFVGEPVHIKCFV
jgi:hypothetical protein